MRGRELIPYPFLAPFCPVSWVFEARNSRRPERETPAPRTAGFKLRGRPPPRPARVPPGASDLPQPIHIATGAAVLGRAARVSRCRSPMYLVFRLANGRWSEK